MYFPIDTPFDICYSLYVVKHKTTEIAKAKRFSESKGDNVMSNSEKREMKEICELRKSIGRPCHDCVYSEVCEKFRATRAKKAETAEVGKHIA